MSLQAWWAKERVRNMGKRIVFSLLALWVHGAVLFFLTMDLFAGNNSSDKRATNPQPQPLKPVEVSLATNPEASVQIEQPKIPPAAIVDQLPPPPEKKPQAEEKPKEESLKDGILDCDSLDKRPQRIVVSPTYLDASPNENISGHVLLHLSLYRDGTVLRAIVESSTMDKKSTDKIAALAFTTIFRPGEIGGVAVDCDMNYEVTITPRGSP